MHWLEQRSQHIQAKYTANDHGAHQWRARQLGTGFELVTPIGLSHLSSFTIFLPKPGYAEMGININKIGVYRAVCAFCVLIVCHLLLLIMIRRVHACTYVTRQSHLRSHALVQVHYFPNVFFSRS
jgi:hypothetical protein